MNLKKLKSSLFNNINKFEHIIIEKEEFELTESLYGAFHILQSEVFSYFGHTVYSHIDELNQLLKRYRKLETREQKRYYQVKMYDILTLISNEESRIQQEMNRQNRETLNHLMLTIGDKIGIKRRRDIS